MRIDIPQRGKLYLYRPYFGLGHPGVGEIVLILSAERATLGGQKITGGKLNEIDVINVRWLLKGTVQNTRIIESVWDQCMKPV